MAYYIKATVEVADKLGVTDIRNKTADGNVLMWQADVAGVPGETVFERAAYVGGALLTAVQAKEETDGTVAEPAPVYTPEYFKPETVPATDIEQPEVADPEPDDADSVPAEEIVPNEPTDAEGETIPAEEIQAPVEETENPVEETEETEEGGEV